MKKYAHIGVGLMLLSLMFFNACKSKKIIQDGPLQKLSTDQLIDAVNKHNVQYKTLSASAKINFESEVESGKAKTNIRIIKDSLIWLNIKKFGLEVSRIMFDQDSVYIIYRFEKVYEKGSFADLSRAFDLDITFDKLQTFFVGQTLAPDPTLSQSTALETQYLLETQHESYFVDYFIDRRSLLVNQFDIEDAQGSKVTIRYDDYKSLDNGQEFSYFREYVAHVESESDTKIEIDISSIEFDADFTIKFEIPSHYTEL